MSSATAVAGERLTAVDFTLSDRCPPSFELLEQGRCRLVTLYDQYDSLRGYGIGGLKTSLGKRRDGFTARQIDLGRYLFFDPLLSGNGQLSCASCHHPNKGFSDARARSVGVLGTEVLRSAPTLWNVAFLRRFFWDGRAKTLEEQIQGPLYSPQEMGNTPAKLQAALNSSAVYRQLFKQAFGSTYTEIGLHEVYTAIAAFESSLVSFNSRYDQYARGYHKALTDQELNGLNVFRSFVARCAQCHTPPLFTNQQIAVIGTPEPEGRALDVGAEKITGSKELKGGFKVPTLRNIEKTAPYMHSGRFDNLYDSVEFYTLGRGHAVAHGVDMHLHWHIWQPDLEEHELHSLVAFLKTLTDESLKPVIPSQVPSGLTPVTHNQKINDT